MSSPWTDLLFLHGHITDWRLARRLSPTVAPPEPAPPAQADAETRDQHNTRRSMLTLRLCLGIGSGELHKQ